MRVHGKGLCIASTKDVINPCLDQQTLIGDNEATVMPSLCAIRFSKTRQYRSSGFLFTEKCRTIRSGNECPSQENRHTYNGKRTVLFSRAEGSNRFSWKNEAVILANSSTDRWPGLVGWRRTVDEGRCKDTPHGPQTATCCSPHDLIFLDKIENIVNPPIVRALCICTAKPVKTIPPKTPSHVHTPMFAPHQTVLCTKPSRDTAVTSSRVNCTGRTLQQRCCCSLSRTSVRKSRTINTSNWPTKPCRRVPQPPSSPRRDCFFEDRCLSVPPPHQLHHRICNNLGCCPCLCNYALLLGPQRVFVVAGVGSVSLRYLRVHHLPCDWVRTDGGEGGPGRIHTASEFDMLPRRAKHGIT